MSGFVLTELFSGGASPTESGALFSSRQSFRLLDPDHGRATTETVALGGVTCARVTSTGHEVALTELDRITLLVPRRGRLKVETRHGEREAEAGDMLILSPDSRRTATLPAPGLDFQASALLFPPSSIVEAARRFDPALPRLLRRAGLAHRLGAGNCAAATRRLSRHVAGLVDELDRADSLLSGPAARQSAALLVCDLLVELLARSGVPGDLPDLASAAEMRRVRRAEEYMRERFDEIASVGEVAEAVGISTRLLQAAFRSARGVTPAEALAGIRLEEARRRLETAAPGVSVSSVALDCGFTHFGRFAQAYRRRHREAPSHTLCRALRPSAGPRR